MKLIVPDCLCLANTAIERQVTPLSPAREKGCTLILSNNQGIYAEVNQHPTHFIVRAALNGGIRDLQLKNITPVTLED
jgi:hypothetical protein